ncbi:gamma-glutamyltransferase family protein [Halotalea alkalilenta]|uniref:gamma-glutamyltransferase family protein n=1 Tax=Halotalea alkalilenta TaxID=376489 RepID=UPI00048966E5|nr:gamma-glutamyltransferase family protein [Halotalea alkalilenta]
MFDFSHHAPYPSQRSATYSTTGMVAASQPQAAQAGREMLARGGNAVDAAIATAAALTVTEPTANGIGGDAFALVWVPEGSTGRLHGLNASGAAPAALSLEAVRAAGHESMPLYGWTPVTVPGAPGAWAELARRFGRLPLSASLAPAIRLAREGFPLSPMVAEMWARAERKFRPLLDDQATRGWFDCFTPGGRAPKAGEIYRNEAQAKTLESIAASGAESFYRGELAERIDAFSQATDGYLRGSDLAAFAPEWVEPVGVDYRGHKIWEIPPNGQGMIALMALRIIDGFAERPAREDLTLLHRQIESLKLAYADGFAHIADPRDMRVAVEALLSEEYALERRALIQDQAIDPTPGEPRAGGTVYLATADREGMMVSFIQSNYHGFGSGVVVPGTGIALHNRGHGFVLDPDHPNALAPGKKPFHTIIPGFITRGDQAFGPFGVMGGFMQPQGHMQVAMNLIDFRLNPQAALDAPRWQWLGGKRVAIEHGYPRHLLLELQARGHQIESAFDSTSFGRGQVILRDPVTGVLCGGTEPRTDASIAVV